MCFERARGGGGARERWRAQRILHSFTTRGREGKDMNGRGRGGRKEQMKKREGERGSDIMDVLELGLLAGL